MNILSVSPAQVKMIKKWGRWWLVSIKYLTIQIWIWNIAWSDLNCNSYFYVVRLKWVGLRRARLESIQHQIQLKPFQAMFCFWIADFHQGDTEGSYHFRMCHSPTVSGWLGLLCSINIFYISFWFMMSVKFAITFYRKLVFL